jgi:hypothetical protein
MCVLLKAITSTGVKIREYKLADISVHEDIICVEVGNNIRVYTEHLFSNNTYNEFDVCVDKNLVKYITCAGDGHIHDAVMLHLTDPESGSLIDGSTIVICRWYDHELDSFGEIDSISNVTEKTIRVNTSWKDVIKIDYPEDSIYIIRFKNDSIIYHDPSNRKVSSLHYD